MHRYAIPEIEAVPPQCHETTPNKSGLINTVAFNQAHGIPFQIE